MYICVLSPTDNYVNLWAAPQRYRDDVLTSLLPSCQFPQQVMFLFVQTSSLRALIPFWLKSFYASEVNNMTHTECVFVALGIQPAKLMRGTIVTTKRQYYIFWVFVCSLGYQTWHSAYALLCHLWPVWMYHIFPHYLTCGTIFEKHTHKHIYIYIQGVTRGTDQTSGGCSLC